MEKMKELIVDQRTINILRREYLRLDSDEKGRMDINNFIPIIAKVCNNEIVKEKLKDLI